MSKQTPGVTRQISWVYTQDLDLAADFYANRLGMECIRDEGKARLYQTADGAAIGVCETFADRVVEPKGGMISLVTDDVDAWYRRLVDCGLDIENPPHRLERFGIYTFFVTDPNGYIIEFQQFES